MRALYTVLIGINKYPKITHRLEGCLNDVELIDACLKETAKKHRWQYYPKILLDEDATRKAIICAFDWFSSATAEDQCIFYFCGHGSYFADQTDIFGSTTRQNQSLVCFDSRTGAKELADKELAYLTYRAMHKRRPFFTAILDCCHSGTAFRSKKDALKYRMLAPTASHYQLEDYEGYQEYLDWGGFKRPPYYPHVTLSACRADQLASETTTNQKKHGLFTFQLCHTLMGANLPESYSSLIAQVAQNLHNKGYEQRPQLDLGGTPANQNPFYDVNFGFTSKADSDNFPLHVFYDRSKGWVVNGGCLHGLSAQESARSPTVVTQCGIELIVTKTYDFWASIEAKPALNHQLFYQARILVSGRTTLKFNWKKDEIPTKLAQKIASLFSDQVTLAPQTNANSNYGITYSHERLIITKKGLPCIPAISASNDKEIVRSLLAIDKWESLLALESPANTHELEQSIELILEVSNKRDYTIYSTANFKADESQYHKVINLYYQKRSESSYSTKLVKPKYKFSITNNSKKKIYVSGLLLSSCYGITDQGMEWYELAPNATAKRIGMTKKNQLSDRYNMYIDDFYIANSFPTISNYFKIFVSTSPELNVSPYRQSSLLKTRYRALGPVKKNIKKLKTARWAVKTLELKLHSPFIS